jgi:eukaryotic-like serine/threonine-protein kinase
MSASYPGSSPSLPPSRYRMATPTERSAEAADGEAERVDRGPGTSLALLIGRGDGLPRAVALRVAIDLCTALEALHTAKNERGEPLALVHRSVSPRDVTIGIDGAARITPADVAAAAPAGEPDGAPARGMSGYTCPEFLRTGVATASSDMYAFGVVVWEMLAGRALVEVLSAGAVEVAVSRAAPRLSTVVAGVPLLLDVVVGKALAPAAIDRFASMQALRVALEGAAQGRIASREAVAAYVAGAARAATASATARSAESLDETLRNFVASVTASRFPSRRGHAA